MGNQNWFEILKDIILTSISNVKEDSIIYENVNYEAFNIYFETERKLYCMQIELNSGINVHLLYHQGYLKNGNKNYVVDPIMTKSTLNTIKKIKRKTLFNWDLRMKKIILYLCECINDTAND